MTDCDRDQIQSDTPQSKRIRHTEREAGAVRPYRPTPHDFRETYLGMGWDAIDEHYRTNYRCIARWIQECGGVELRGRSFSFHRCSDANA